MKIKHIDWVTMKEGDLIIGQSPIGKFIIEKESRGYIVEKTPWNNFGGAGKDLEVLKADCEEQYFARITECISE